MNFMGKLHQLNAAYQAHLTQTDFKQKILQRGCKPSLTNDLKRLIKGRGRVQNWSAE